MTLSLRNQWLIGLILASFILLTRSHHFSSLHHLPDTSWAAFFIAGVYLRSLAGFGALFGFCVLVDFIALTFGTGDNSSCFSLAYAMLLPAYASLWWAGRWYSQQHRANWATLLPLMFAIVAGTLACELLSSGSYYAFSGQFQPNLSEYFDRFALYYPAYLSSTLLYVGIAAVVHAVLLGNKTTGLRLKSQ